MKPKYIRYYVQTNVDGTYDIVRDTTINKIVANTSSQEAAEEIIRYLSNEIKK